MVKYPFQVKITVVFLSIDKSHVTDPSVLLKFFVSHTSPQDLTKGFGVKTPQKGLRSGPAGQ
jgi:hypothetical protein